MNQASRTRTDAYQKSFASQSKAALLLDAQLRILDCNPLACQLFRCTREDLTGADATRLVPVRQPDGSESLPGLLAGVAAARAGLPQSLLAHLRAFDDSGFEAMVQLESVELDGRLHVIAKVRDLTRLRQAEHALESSELRLRQFLDNTPAIAFVRDLEGRYLVVNRRFCEMYGKSESEIVGSRNSDLLPPEVVAQANDNTARVFDTRAALEFEEELIVNGKRMTFLAIRFPLLDRDGRPYAVCVISMDITQRKRAERALQASEQQYRSVFDASVDGLAVLDERGGFVDVNPAFLDLLGHARETLYARGFRMLLADNHVALFDELLAQVADGRPFRAECSALTAQGGSLDIELRGARMDYQGRPHVLAMLRDLTQHRREEAERARLAEQLRQAQKMEAIGHLTGGIAHDFNNILTSVMGYVALAADQPACQHDALLERYLDEAYLAATRARDLIRQMLTFSRGRGSEPKVIHLSAMVTESLRLVRSTLPATIEIETDLEAEAPTALIDPVQMGQVLLNLCINARDAMPHGGRLRVGVKMTEGENQICASCRAQVSASAYLELYVSDTGAGIEAPLRERIFEPFFTTKEVGKGSGMGLAMVHGIVHEHGGHLLLDSAVGAGATFRILLPMTQHDTEARDSKSAIDTPLRARGRRRLNGTVMVVEDDRMVSTFMSDLLEFWGLNVVLCANPEDAIALLGAEPDRIDLVLTDYTMPKGTGLDLARHIHTARPAMPIILYSGQSDALDREQTSRAGVCAVVSKPVDADALRELLLTYLPTDDSVGSPITSTRQ